ncbi:hypothetical protein [Nitrosomonas sp.]|uniref:hypothetical protein n=1 Tax=Nitrosomonas sp. TaxID=42353 RepID=UPI003305DDBA
MPQINQEIVVRITLQTQLAPDLACTIDLHIGLSDTPDINHQYLISASLRTA